MAGYTFSFNTVNHHNMIAQHYVGTGRSQPCLSCTALGWDGAIASDCENDS